MIASNHTAWKENVRMIRALHHTVEMLEDSSKNALLYHLIHTCNIRLDDKFTSSVPQIYNALESLLGREGANVLIHHFMIELRKQGL